MDLSFFDHPPMVAWLIWLGTAHLRRYGVRRSHRRIHLRPDHNGLSVCAGTQPVRQIHRHARRAAVGGTAVSVLSPGMLMTADAPLVAAWAATLYYMERALIADQRSAWLGMGIAFGLGILSKYTLGLLGPAALLFVILDPASRRWLRRPQPYLAAALALLMFSPVIIWNMEQRLGIDYVPVRAGHRDRRTQFSLHMLLFLHMLLMLTPVGLLAAAMAVWPGAEPTAAPTRRRRRLFVTSIHRRAAGSVLRSQPFGAPKFHWTGPVWLALLPTMAWMMGQAGDLQYHRTPRESGLETHHRGLPVSLRIRTALCGARHSRHPL